MKKRIGNDFLIYWILTENGTAIDISQVLNFGIVIRHDFTGSETTADFEISDGSPVVKCSKELLTKLGKYYLIATWKVVDSSFPDGYRDCAADVSYFEIVPKSEQEDEDGNTVTSEVALGFKGDSAFIVWQKIEGNEDKTEDDYFAYLRQPATDVADLANEATEDAIAAAILANSKAQLADSKATLADQKATLADQKATLANEAATLANSKAQAAETATTNANNAEGLRATAEQGRVTAESGRTTAEGNRVTAETSRAGAETTRGTNETTRQSNETTRVNQENARVIAENARVAAGYVTSPQFTQIVQLTQAQYDALTPKVATTLYIIIQA